MHFYTEAPITSFFPRITATKKRKIHTELTPSSPVGNKRQRVYTFTTFGQTKAKKDEQEYLNTLDNRTISILHSQSLEDLSGAESTSERYMPLLPSLNVTSQSPNPNTLPSREKCNPSLQAPPPTNARVEKQWFMEPTPTLSPFISLKSPDLCIEKVLLPTPSTLGRSVSHHNGHSDNDRCRVVQRHLSHQDSSSLTPPQHSDTSLKASIPASIPSSQSQLMADAYSNDEYYSTPASEALPCKKLQLHEYEVQPSPSNRVPLNRRHKGKSTFYATQMFIPSSQSQFLSPLEHDSPQTSQPASIMSSPELDIIPSSQSQEKELRKSNDPEECHQSIRPMKQALPRRTFLDDRFSVSLLQSCPDGSLVSEQPVQGTADVSCIANHGDDSATESETEPETDEKDSYYRNHHLTPMQSQPYEFSQPLTADFASIDDDSQHENSRNPHQSSQDLSLANRTCSCVSLPSVVTEFQNMFGSSDESYPPDFPMSLR